MSDEPMTATKVNELNELARIEANGPEGINTKMAAALRPFLDGMIGRAYDAMRRLNSTKSIQ